MTDSDNAIPSPRADALDKLSTRVEEQREEMQLLKHDIRRIHKRSHDGTTCLEDTLPWPCPTMQRVDRGAVTSS